MTSPNPKHGDPKHGDLQHRNPKHKLLLGAGPSNADPRALRAMIEPTLGHLDPDFLAIMDETADLLRYVFNTKNHLTLALPATGTGGMEAAVVNSVERGDKMLVCVAGAFGDRMAQVAERAGAVVVRLDSKWGRPVDPDDVRKLVKSNPDARVLGIVHAETSTGVLQPLDEIAEIAHENGLRMVVDAVTSLGGMDVPVDRLNLDFVYSGSQKCLSSVPGIAPVTVNETAASFMANRKSACQSWYLDLGLIRKYWGSERFYHHTAPSNLIYSLNESLRIIKEEGLQARYARHLESQKVLIEGLETMGLRLVVDPEHRLPALTTVYIPEGVEDAAVRRQLLHEFNIEISGGLGELKGKVWRIGLMGTNSTRANVIYLLSALGDILGKG